MKLAIIFSSLFNLMQLIPFFCHPCPMTEDASESNSLPTCEVFFANVGITCPAKWVLQSQEIIENNIVSSNSKIMSKNLSQELRYRLVTSPGHPT